jgi:hypothetical protein
MTTSGASLPFYICGFREFPQVVLALLVEVRRHDAMFCRFSVREQETKNCVAKANVRAKL